MTTPAPARGWERQATGWTIVYRVSVVLLLIVAVASARAAQSAAEHALQIAAQNRATLADIKDELDDLSHR